LLLISLVFIVPLELMRLPAALLLGAMAAAILVAVFDGKLAEPHWPCYALVGWSIGLRFSREIVIYAARAFPKIAASTLTLIALCGGLAVLLRLIVGTEPLTAYLATSPGGADSVAIIAASSSHVDIPFVTAMQMARFILVLLVGPALARAVARWTKS
jgi:membrane AbrB-like protein